MTAAGEEFDLLGCPLDGTHLVEASAGTGKTWTLCGLVLRLLLERAVELPRILVVTFTNAAVDELRERIRLRIVEAQRVRKGEAPGDDFLRALLPRAVATHGADAVDRRLALALASFDDASIHTIHGLCQRALAESPFSAGAPLATEAIDDDRDLVAEVARDFWRRRVAAGGVDPRLARRLVGRGDSPERFADLLARRIARPLSLAIWPDAADPGAVGADIADWQALHDEARALWQRERDAIVAIVDAARDDLRRNVWREGALDAVVAAWDRLLAGADPLEHFELPDKAELFGAARLKTNKGRPPLAAHRFFAVADRWLGSREACLAALDEGRTALLRALLDEEPRALRALKAERRVVGFDDMLFLVHRRLHEGDDAFAARLRQRYAAALVDEFQDTDPLQFEIIERLFGDGRSPTFLVGDPKQAIYAFRNADLHTYLHARDRAASRATLRRNQRSCEALIDGLNALFGTTRRPFALEGLDYVEVERGSKPIDPLVDLSGPDRAALQLWRLPRGDDGEPLPKAQAEAVAAQGCATEIGRLLRAARRGEVTVGGRALAAGDIAVLVRTHRHGTIVRDALAARGVASVELSPSSVFATGDAAQLRTVLEAVADPSREPLLRAALATEAMGLDAAAIDALVADAATLVERVKRFADLQRAWLRSGIAAALRRWIDGEGVAERLLARSDGERRMTNLLHLAELLQHAEHDHRSPQALLRWLRARIADPHGGEQTQLRLESDRDRVQVVTIHRAKGLEYPLVFCPLLFDGHAGRAARAGDGLEYHDDRGRPVIDFRTLDKAQRQAIDERLGVERLSEQLRLIYVALTRAVHRCHVVVGAYTTRTSHGTSTDKPSRRAALNWLAAGGGADPVEWNRNGPDALRVEAAWDALGAVRPGAIGIDALPSPTAERVEEDRPAPEDIAACEPPARIAPGWAIGSYSALVHGARHESAASDHDQRGPWAPAADGAEVGPALAPDDVLGFPRGAAAGDCLHALFERVDFADPGAWPAAIDAVLREHAAALPAVDGAGAAAAWPAMLLRMLGDVLGTPLPGAGPLAALPASRRRAEVEFHLPARRLDAGALAALLARHAIDLPTLAQRELSGYLRGFVDLVFEHGGRWFLLDWKSNHLGRRPDDYGVEALDRAMAANAYHLQALLYTLALHRWLGTRIDGYRYDRHFGGAFYLFVRGVRPGWRDANGRPCGVHAQRAPVELVEALSALLDGNGVMR